MTLLAIQGKIIDEEAAYVKRTGETSFSRPFNPDNPDTRKFNEWVFEAQNASKDWRAESWRDCEMFDGEQWSDAMLRKAIDAGIEPLTINQIFPTLSLVIGSQALNKQDVIAKARTHKDGELAQIMTEGIKYVMDQSGGEFKISEQFKSQVTAGFGCLSVGYDNDPRNEIIKIGARDWKEIWWDPYASPWMDINECRYVFHSKWVDLHNIFPMFPDKKAEINEAFQSSVNYIDSRNSMTDEATEVEWKKRIGSGGWLDATRKRCRPVEMWYTVNEPAFFLRYPDGSIEEMPENQPIMIQFQKIQQSVEVIQAIVKRMRVCTFLGDMVLEESRTPYAHDDFPFIPFVGYLDRFNNPYGVPRQIRDMQIEVNKRRSMALRLLNARRVIMETDAVEESNKQAIYEEANKPDGFLMVRSGAMEKIKIVEQAQLAPSQMSMMNSSEQEIQRVSGVNADMSSMGHRASEAVGVVENRTNQGVTITAPLFENMRRSIQRLGEQIVAAIQHKWTGEKVLRITDRMSGAERFVEINKKYETQYGMYEVKNDVTQGKYDVVIAEIPIADTMREQSMNLLVEWTKKSTPEMVPHILSAALELSNIPNKDRLLAKIKPLLGISPDDDDLSVTDVKKKQAEEAQRKAQIQQMMEQISIGMSQAGLQKLQTEIQKLQAETARILGNAQLDPLRQEQISTKIEAEHQRARNDAAKVEIDGFKAGANAQHQSERLVLDGETKGLDWYNKEADREQADDHKYADVQKELERTTHPAESVAGRTMSNLGTRPKNNSNL